VHRSQGDIAVMPHRSSAAGGPDGGMSVTSVYDLHGVGARDSAVPKATPDEDLV